MNFIIYFWFVWLDFFFVFGWMGLKFNPAEWSRMCVCVCVRLNGWRGWDGMRICIQSGR